ncbi:hypothetical protein AC578_6466, partial [Pseudocercospora eumusae]
LADVPSPLLRKRGDIDNSDTDDSDEEVLNAFNAGQSFEYKSTDLARSGAYLRAMNTIRDDWLAFRAHIARKQGEGQATDGVLFPDPLTQGVVDAFLQWCLKTKGGKLERKICLTTLQRSFTSLKSLHSFETGRRLSEEENAKVSKALRARFVKKGASLKAKRRSLANRAVVADLLSFL